MKIQKKFQGTVPDNKILDTFSESTTDTYSCSTINGMIDSINLSGKFDETDPTVPQHVKNITSADISNWNKSLKEDVYFGKILKGKTASFYGDSLTEANYHYTKGYHEWIKNILELSSYNNYGVSGYKMVDIYNKICSIDDESDIIFVMGGVNDEGNGTSLGDINDNDTSTVCGCINLICSKLNEKYPTKTKIFITPHFQTKYTVNEETTTYTVSKKMKEICEKYSIMVFDNYVISGINTHNLSHFTTDNCHWNNAGHEKLGKNISRFLYNSIRYIYDTSEKTLDSINAILELGNNTITTNDNLDTLRQYLTVIAYYTDMSQDTIQDYELSGELKEGENSITVTYSNLTTSFTVNVVNDEKYRYLTLDDVNSSGGITGLQITDGNITATSYTTFCMVEFKPSVTKIKGTFGSSLFLIYKKNNDGSYNCIDTFGKMFTLSPGSSSATSLGECEDFTRVPENTDITVSIRNNVLIIEDDSIVYARVPNSDVLGFWTSNNEDTRANTMLKSIQVNIVPTKKATKLTVLSHENVGNFVHLTALIRNDEDIFNGSVIQTVFKGKDCFNMWDDSHGGAQIFSDTSGEVGNGLWVEVISTDNSVEHSQVLDGTNVTVNMAARTLTKSISEPYVKVPIMVFGDRTKQYGCTIDEIKVIVNGKEKEIIKLGTFFETEVITLEEIDVSVDNDLIYEWNFTKGLSDTIAGKTAVLGGTTVQNSKGLVFTNNTDYADLGSDIMKRNVTLEIDFGYMNAIFNNINGIFFWTTVPEKHGFGWNNKSGNFGGFWTNAWQDFSGEYSKNYFASSTLKITIDENGVIKYYKNDGDAIDMAYLSGTTAEHEYNLFQETDTYLRLGSSTDAYPAFKYMEIKSVRIYNGVH